MKFKSATLNVRETVSVFLRKTLSITVGSLPMGIDREFQAIWPKPTAPYKEVSKVGQPTAREYNYDDAVFSKQYDEWVYHRNIYYFWRCIDGIDSDISFDNKCDAVPGILAVAAELKVAGFSDLDIGVVLKAASKISTVSEEDVATAKQSF